VPFTSVGKREICLPSPEKKKKKKKKKSRRNGGVIATYTASPSRWRSKTKASWNSNPNTKGGEGRGGGGASHKKNRLNTAGGGLGLGGRFGASIYRIGRSMKGSQRAKKMTILRGVDAVGDLRRNVLPTVKVMRRSKPEGLGQFVGGERRQEVIERKNRRRKRKPAWVGRTTWDCQNGSQCIV